MKNIHVLPTDKPSRLIHNDANQLCYQSNSSFKNDRKIRKKFNIYIINLEEIKEGDWCINTCRLNETIIFPDKIIGKADYTANLLIGSSWNKIILTDNKDLIKDGVQAIDDEFLEWFVKNPSCEGIDIEIRE